jgi:hypothetical protein
MCRNLTLEEKKAKLICNSFQSLDENIRNGTQISRENYNNFREQILALIEYFVDKKVYVVDSPINTIPHPETRRRLVDPLLNGTPANKTIPMISAGFDSFYDLTNKITEHLENNEEVFIYVIQVVIQYSPMNFEPIMKPIIRYCTINTDYWYDINYQEITPTQIEPERYFERYNTNRNVTSKENEGKPTSIGDSKLVYKF